MTPSAQALLHDCASRVVIVTPDDTRWEAVGELLGERMVRFDWMMRGASRIVPTERGVWAGGVVA